MRSVERAKRSQKIKRGLLILLLLVLLFGGRYILEAISYIPVFWGVKFNKTISLKQSEDKKINILLLGIGGGKHDGPNLTDTIIFASIDTSSKSAQATLVSIPRDLWVPDIKGKINRAYSDGEESKEGGGLLLAKAVVGKILNQPVDYALRVDFAGFVKAVDMVGGIDVTVERTFDDFEYPISGKEADDCGYKDEEFQKRATDSAQLEAFPCRYEHLHFDQGTQHMDGETALRFVRSRHAIGPEGSDFSRSQRQEKVIVAFKDKVLSLGTLLNPIKLASLYDVFKGSIDTDIQQSEYDDFIKLAEKMKEGSIQSAVIDAGDTSQERIGFLENPPLGENGSDEYGFQWVLVPTKGNGNYSDIQEYVACMISHKGSCDLMLTPSPNVRTRE